MDRGERFGFAVRVVDMHLPPVAVLKKVGAWLRDLDAGLRAHLVCSGIMLESAALRGGLRFVHAISPSPAAFKTFATFEETEAWVVAQLQAQGLVVSDSDV